MMSGGKGGDEKRRVCGFGEDQDVHLRRDICPDVTTFNAVLCLRIQKLKYKSGYPSAADIHSIFRCLINPEVQASEVGRRRRMGR